MADNENTALRKAALKISLPCDNTQVTPNDSPNVARKLSELTPNSIDPNSDIVNPDVPVKKWWEKLQVELFVFMYMFGYSVSTTTNANLFMERACLVNFNYSSEVCFNLSSYQHVLDKVQAESNNMSMYGILIAMVPGALYAMFVGSWSDKYGRKPPLIVAVIGSIFQDTIFLFFVYFDALRVEYFLLSYVPVALTGGMISILGMIYSLQSDKSQVSKRTLKYAILEGFLFVAIPISGLVSGQIYKYYGYIPVYGIGLIVHVITLAFGLIYITDNRADLIKASVCTKMADFFSTETLKDNFKTCMKKRENKQRAQILLLMPSGCVLILNYISLASLTYLFANKMYGWDLPHYTVVSTVFSIASMVFMIIMVPILTLIMKLSDAILGVIGIASLLAQNLCRGFAYEPWIFYMSFSFGLLSGLGPLAFRSKLSKSVRGDELGKIFSVLAIFEALAPTPGTLFVTYIYNNTLEVFPGLVFVITSTLLIYPLGVFIWLMTLPTVIQPERLNSSETDLSDQETHSTSIQAKA